MATRAVIHLFPFYLSFGKKEGMIDPSTIIIDAKSGDIRRGKRRQVDNLFCEVNENIKAYGVAGHRHPEIEEQLSLCGGKTGADQFTPHLVPMNRGILITAYASLTGDFFSYEVKPSRQRIRDEFFVRVLEPGRFPQDRRNG